jgi:phosphohistidine phosphatase SixA
MSQRVILIMRHAEKSGDPLDPDLTSAGRARAEALADYIPKTFGAPAFLFASAVSKHSRRPIETLTPLAARCKLTIDDSYADQDYGALAQHLRKSDDLDQALTVVCWHHGNIPLMMNALKAAEGDYPDPWDRDVFNLILQVTLGDKKQPPKVKAITEPF